MVADGSVRLGMRSTCMVRRLKKDVLTELPPKRRQVIELPRAGFRSMPWANGGGVTHELAVHPIDASLQSFDWRVSLAEVREPTWGPFTRP